mmetsp:Transcript_3322/g.7238  ORF Transcript_3322/g.7238 Transcript_3322/m.7238 type:complete len:211 (-) Transcript_3322:51-683(-)
MLSGSEAASSSRSRVRERRVPPSSRVERRLSRTSMSRSSVLPKVPKDFWRKVRERPVASTSNSSPEPLESASTSSACLRSTSRSASSLRELLFLSISSTSAMSVLCASSPLSGCTTRRSKPSRGVPGSSSSSCAPLPCTAATSSPSLLPARSVILSDSFPPASLPSSVTSSGRPVRMRHASSLSRGRLMSTSSSSGLDTPVLRRSSRRPS